MKAYNITIEFSSILDRHPVGAAIQVSDILKDSAELLTYKVTDVVTKDVYTINLETNECRQCDEPRP